MFNDHWTKSVHHDGSPFYVVGQSFKLGSNITLRVRADVEAPIERVFLRATPNGEQRMQEMRPAQVEGVSRWWEIDLELRMPRTNYRFFIQSSPGGYWLSAAGITRHAPTDATDFKVLANYHEPAWVHE